MRKNIPQIVTMLVLAIVITMALPSSFAKYSHTDEYTINLSKELTSTETPFTSGVHKDSSICEEVSLTQSGYYLIIAKGGDGADGYVRKYDSSNNLDNEYSRYGGDGGTITGIIQNTNPTGSTNSITVCVGSRGTDPGDGSKGAGGTNPLSESNNPKFSGGSGNDTVGTSAADAFSSHVASGGGGAASVVYSGSVYSSSNLIAIAGGGGAGGSWQKEGFSIISGAIETYASGFGGNAGTNVSGSSILSGTIFNGASGTTEAYKPDETVREWQIYHFVKVTKVYKCDTFGVGGSSSGGSGGNSTSFNITVFEVPNGVGGQGGSFNEFGNGGSATMFGGGGGAGYCGGGSGTGTSIYVGSGGGGGGSSYLSSTCTLPTYALYSRILAQYTTGEDPDLSASDLENGYVIVEYLGETIPTA